MTMHPVLLMALLASPCLAQFFNRPALPPPPPSPPFFLNGAFSRSTSEDASSNASARPGNEAIVANSVQEFTLDLSFEQWNNGNGGNMLFSPVSIGSLLSLLMLGTNGPSQEELKKALYYPSIIPEENIHRSYQSVIEGLSNNVPGVEVKLSNELFLQQGFPVLRDFSEKALEHYKAGVRGVNFRSDPIGTMRTVNGVVRQATNGKIDEIVQRPFSSSTQFIAVNSIYFNGLWEYPFDKRTTYEGTFNTGTRNISIPMMVNEIEVPMLNNADLGLDMIALPYKGGKYSMYILTPRGNNGVTSLIRLERGLDGRILNSLINSMKVQKVAVTLPRMSMRHKFSLRPDLERLGVATLFGSSADFSKMTNQNGNFLDEVIHEAVLELTETGTVAAAASIGTTDRILVKRFAVDKPSLIFIRDESNKVILFWARLVEPTPLRT